MLERYKRRFEEKYDFDMTITDKKSIKKFLDTEMKLNLNGYIFNFFENGLYHFSKRDDDFNSPTYGKYMTMVVSQEQLFNGDAEFMAKNNMTLDDSRKRKEVSKYKNYLKKHTNK